MTAGIGLGGVDGGTMSGFMVRAVAGGGISVLQGGKFGHGFATAGTGMLVGNATVGMRPGSQFVLSTLAGGAASRATGGKFANGAVTAAMAYAFSQLGRSGGQAAAPGEGDIVVGFYGAGGTDLDDNQQIAELGSEFGARMFKARAVLGAPVGEATDYVLAGLDVNPSARVFIFGYSAGGHAAIGLAHSLNAHGVPVAGLVTFDPHSHLRLFGYRTYDIPRNVGRAINFYQHNQVRFFGGEPVSRWVSPMCQLCV